MASDRPDITFACQGCSQSGEQRVRTSHVCSVSDDTCCTRQELCGGFPSQDEESIMTIDGLSDARTRDARHLEGAASVNTPWCAWSSTQKVVSQSSVESGYHSVVRCASEAIGLANTSRELGHEARVRIWTDVAAARGLALRSGSGAINHVETKYFWPQQNEKNKGLRTEKIP